MFKRSRAGYTLMEAIAAFMLASGVLIAVGSYFLHAFRMSLNAREEGDVVANVQLAFAYLEKKLFDLDNVYLKSENQVIFRSTYIPEGAVYDGTFDSLKSRWGCFWYRDVDDEGTQVKELRYYQSEEMSYHDSTGLVWQKVMAIKDLDDLNFEYANKTLKLELAYTQNKKSETREMVFMYPKARDTADQLAEEEEPTWD